MFMPLMPTTKFILRIPRWTAILLLLALALLISATLWWLLENEALNTLAYFNTWLADSVIKRFGYWGVFLLMTVESSFVPFPSELVILPAGDLARRLPDWTLTGVIISGTLGSLAGAIINYGLARWLGRLLTLRLLEISGRWLRISVASYQRTEQIFLKYGYISTFCGRLLPVIRQLISLPAGLARMPILPFAVLTTIGAGIWVSLLAWLGFRFGQDHQVLTQQLKQNSLWVIIAVLTLLIAWIAWRLRQERRSSRS